jgi:phosphate transport system substrate-binding protein
MNEISKLGLAAASVSTILGFSSAGYGLAQQSLAPKPGSGYVLRDGTVRIVGDAGMQRVIEALNVIFVAKHPGLKFRYEPADANGAISALIFDATAVAPIGSVYGGGIAYSDIVKAPPFSVRIAHGSLLPQAKISPLAVIVNPANPAKQLTLTQLASIFSKPARAPVYATWAQVGVKTAANTDLITPAGLPWSDHFASEDRTFGDEVFYRKFGGAPPVDDYSMFNTYAQVVRFVAHEPGAIGIVPINKVSAEVKTLAVPDGAFGIPREATTEEVKSGRYPLDRYLYLYLRVQTGKPLDPLVREYVEMVLSPDGQGAIAKEGEGYLPLSARELAEERNKFE